MPAGRNPHSFTDTERLVSCKHTNNAHFGVLYLCMYSSSAVIHNPSSPPHNNISFLLDSSTPDLIFCSYCSFSCGHSNGVLPIDCFLYSRGEKQSAAICQACWSTPIYSVNQMRGGTGRCGIFRGVTAGQTGARLCEKDIYVRMSVVGLSNIPRPLRPWTFTHAFIHIIISTCTSQSISKASVFPRDRSVNMSMKRVERRETEKS